MKITSSFIKVLGVVALALIVFAAGNLLIMSVLPSDAEQPPVASIDSTGTEPAIWNDLPREEFRYEIVETESGQIVGAKWLRVGVWYRDDSHLFVASEQLEQRRQVLFGNFSPLAELQYLEQSYSSETKHYGLEGAYRLYVDLATGEPLIGSFTADGELVRYIPVTETVLPSASPEVIVQGANAPLPAGMVGDF